MFWFKTDLRVNSNSMFIRCVILCCCLIPLRLHILSCKQGNVNNNTYLCWFVVNIKYNNASIMPDIASNQPSICYYRDTCDFDLFAFPYPTSHPSGPGEFKVPRYFSQPRVSNDHKCSFQMKWNSTTTKATQNYNLKCIFWISCLWLVSLLEDIFF